MGKTLYRKIIKNIILYVSFGRYVEDQINQQYEMCVWRETILKDIKVQDNMFQDSVCKDLENHELELVNGVLNVSEHAVIHWRVEVADQSV